MCLLKFELNLYFTLIQSDHSISPPKKNFFKGSSLHFYCTLVMFLRKKKMKLKPKASVPITWFLISVPSKINHSTLRNDGFHGCSRKYKMSLKQLKPVRLCSKEMGKSYKDMEDGSSNWPNLRQFQHQNKTINTE